MKMVASECTKSNGFSSQQSM